MVEGVPRGAAGNEPGRAPRASKLSQRAGAACPPERPGRSRRPVRFVARRTAWHALDHAWEILDKQQS